MHDRSVGPAPRKPRTCKTDGSLCGGSCNGSSASGCGYPDIATVCRAGSCDTPSNVATVEAGCDGAGACPSLQVQDCGRFVCGATACAGDCAPPNGVCSAGNYCSGGVCVPKVQNGKACGSGLQCQSTYCVDAVCCDQDCKGQCQACDVSGSTGTCSTVTDSGPPHGGRFRCDGSGPCKGVCNGSKPDGCTLPDSSVLCAPPSCTSEVATSAAACNGSGACSMPETKSRCSPFVCGVTSCRTLCAAPTDCVRGYDCIAQHCVPLGQTMADVDAALEVSTEDSATMVPVTVDAGVADSSKLVGEADAVTRTPKRPGSRHRRASPAESKTVAVVVGGAAAGFGVCMGLAVPSSVMVARARRARRRRSDRLS